MNETRRDKVLNLLNDGLWHTTVEISDRDTGGTEGTRRVRELRELGHNIKIQPLPGSSQYVYRLVQS